MDEKSFNIRIPRRWVRLSLVVLVTTLIVAPLTAIASHSFTDVPDSNIFHNDIEWLKDAGVTKGCNPPSNTEFCPKDVVSREAMAAFMRRFAQYIDAEDGIPGLADHATTADSATTADDADKLDGKDSTQLASRAAFASSAALPDENTTLDVAIEAPATGILVMNAGVRVLFDQLVIDGFDDVTCELMVDGVAVEGTTMVVTVSDPPDEPLNNPCNTTGAFVVGAGAHTVTFDIRNVGSALLDDASLNVIWVPFDGTGAVPTAVAGQAGTGDDDGDGR